MKFKKWTDKEQRILVDLFQEGMSVGLIKHYLDYICYSYRTETAIASRLGSLLGIDVPVAHRSITDFPETVAMPSVLERPSDEVTRLLKEVESKLKNNSILKIKEYLEKHGCHRFRSLPELRSYLERYGYKPITAKLGTNFKWYANQEEILQDLMAEHVDDVTTIAKEYNNFFGLERSLGAVRSRIKKIEENGVTAPEQGGSVPTNNKWTRAQVRFLLDNQNDPNLAKKFEEEFSIPRSEKALTIMLKSLSAPKEERPTQAALESMKLRFNQVY
jgi:hypothetical protein